MIINLPIVAFFTKGGIPQTGLSPTIRVRDVSTTSLLVTDASMTEVGDGAYKYDFTTYDVQKNYSIVCDGGTTLPGVERYMFAGNEVDSDAIRKSLANKMTLEKLNNNNFRQKIYDDDKTTVISTVSHTVDGQGTEQRDPQ